MVPPSAFPDDLALATRAALPAEYRLLLADYPRAGWPEHRDFNGLAAFWLDRHLGFRRVIGLLRADAAAMIDKRMAPQAWGQRLLRLGRDFWAIWSVTTRSRMTPIFRNSQRSSRALRAVSTCWTATIMRCTG